MHKWHACLTLGKPEYVEWSLDCCPMECLCRACAFCIKVYGIIKKKCYSRAKANS